jgi:SAM-dependent methyltransferase
MIGPDGGSDQVKACPACGGTASRQLFRTGDCALRSVPDEFCYRRCAKCASVFAAPPPTDATLAAAYSAEYGNYDEHRGVVERLAEPVLRREAVRVLRAVGPKAADRPLLEIGCGTCRFLERLDRAGWSGPLGGVEYSPRVAKRAAERTGYDVRHGTAENLSLSGAPYGALVLRHVIEHLREPRAVLRRLLGALHPEGVVYIATPDASALSARVFGRRWWGYEVPRHLCVFTSGALRAATREAGGQCVREWWAFAPQMWNASMFLALDRGRGKAWPCRATSLFNPLVTGPASVGAAAEVALHRSTMYGLLARRAPVSQR